MDITQSIILGLINNKKYARKVLPHIKGEYFPSYEERYLYEIIRKYVIEYKDLPKTRAIRTILGQKTDINENVFQTVSTLVDTLDEFEFDSDTDWLIDETERWCKERSLYNAIYESVDLFDKKKNLDSIPDIVREALRVSFNSSVGQEFIDETDIANRWEYYHRKAKKYATGIETLDNILGGGFEDKTVNCFLAGTNVGKTAAMIATSANMIRDGHDVLYVTLEMAEEKIAQRYEANFLDTEINDIPFLDEEQYKDDMLNFKNEGYGRLLIKEFAAASINVNHLRALLSELEIKRNFKPNVIVIDYLNCMLSCRYASENLYTTIKGISEELRGLAVDEEVCIITATQGNREMNGANVANADLTNTSESIGLPAVMDSMIAIMFPEEYREQNIQIWKILKNRYSGIVQKRFPISVNLAKGQVFDGKDANIRLDDAADVDVKTEERRQKTKKIRNSDFDVTEDLSSFFEDGES